jgi:hypothetical protein
MDLASKTRDIRPRHLYEVKSVQYTQWTGRVKMHLFICRQHCTIGKKDCNRHMDRVKTVICEPPWHLHSIGKPQAKFSYERRESVGHFTSCRLFYDAR